MKSRAIPISTVLAIASMMSLTACAPAGPTATATATAPASPPASPTANPSATSAPSPAPTTPDPGPVDPLGFGDETTIPLSSDGAAYSGCSPNSHILPTGIYIGYTSTWNTQEVHFDLICMWSGEEANAHMIADGLEPDPYIEDPWYITNDNPTIRVIPVGLNGNIEAKKCDSDTIYPLADVIGDPGGTVILPSPPYLIRIYVTDGEITALACHFLP